MVFFTIENKYLKGCIYYIFIFSCLKISFKYLEGEGYMLNKQVQIQGIYIPSIEACWLYKFNQEQGDYLVDEKYLDKLLNGKLDYSFELIKDEDLINSIEVKELDNQYYTLDVVNVKFNKKYKKDNEEKNTKELRDWCYENGFKFNGKLMTNWKRSSGKARVGQNLFLLDSIKDKCLSWARMDLEFADKVDIGSIRAYESLSLSSIIGAIEIDPKGILVIADFESKFDWKMSKTWLENGELITKTDVIEECNSIWDGEGLLSNKIFDENELIKGKGVALLRNRYTKCAAFCCYIEKFFRKYCEDHGLDYDTYEIEDMYHNKIKVKDILLITTPSAIKIAKYNDNKTIREKGYEGEGAWLQYWKDRCGKVFGVCKVEKPSHYENGNVLSYQMVNTIPFKKEELRQLIAPEIQYVERLKKDLDFFLQEINQLKEISEELENDILIEADDDNEVEIGSNIDVAGAFIKLSKKNPSFANTQVFKDYRRNFINAYIKRLRQGKIRIEGADYCVACGNPIELLKATVEEFDGVTSVLNGNELYCSRFEDGEDVIGFRNPHINFSNIGIQVNKEIQEIKDYMYITPNIVYLNSIKYPTLSTYQGEDFDIDCNLLTNHPIIVDACKRIDKSINGIPVNLVENTGKNDKELNANNMSDVDHIISQNFIGSTINLSQELNSLMNHAKYNNLFSKDELNKLYDMTSKCSSISCCEIDKAKKQFETLDVPGELDKMKEGLELVDNENINNVKEEIQEIKKELDEKKVEVRKYRKNKRKPILKEIRNIKKILAEGVNKELEKEINNLQLKIESINIERQDEIDVVKDKIFKKYEELKQYDSRRIKPYFFKFIGDNEAKKQRKATNKKHRKELDKSTIAKYVAENKIEVDKVDMKDKKLIELLKANDKIQQEWEDKIYRKLDTPMDWLQDELDKIKNKKPVGTVQVIQLVKKNKHKANEETVNYIVECIKYLDIKIKAYRLKDELTSKEKLDKIRNEKKRVINEIIRYMKLNKSDLYGMLKECLNSVKNNGKVNKKSGIESLSLEILFKAYGTGLLDMFIQ